MSMNAGDALLVLHVVLDDLNAVADHVRGDWYGRASSGGPGWASTDGAQALDAMVAVMLEAIDAVERAVQVWSSLNPPSGDDQRGRP